MIWFEIERRKERLKEEKEAMIWEMMMRENGKKKERQIKTIEKNQNQNLFHSFIHSNSNISFQLWVDWLIDWDDLRFIWEWEKNEKNQKSHFSLKIQNKIKIKMKCLLFSFLFWLIVFHLPPTSQLVSYK